MSHGPDEKFTGKNKYFTVKNMIGNKIKYEIK